MTQPKRKRHRGVILTPKGFEKLKEARLSSEVQDNFGESYTHEQIRELTSLDINTIKKVLTRDRGVDKRTIEKFFRAFGLELRDEFYTKPKLIKQEDWGEAVAIDYFFGRTQELELLSNWLLQDRCRLITLLGMGGIGKTTLSIKLAQGLGSEFDYVIWKSLRDAPPVEEIVTYVIEFLSQGREKPENLSPKLGGKISRLISYLRSARCLILLDNAESLMDIQSRAGKYLPGYEGYGELLRRIGATAHNSCLVLTTREKPKEVAILEGDRLPVRSLKLLGLKEGHKIIQIKGLVGSDLELTALRDRYNGNPLALKVVSATIKDLFAGDISEFLQQEKAVFGDTRDLLEQQFTRLTDLEQEIMYWMAVIREPVSWDRLRGNFVFQVSPIKLLEALESLSRRSLIEKNAALFTQQSVVMEYITARLVDSICQEITEGQPILLRSHALIEATAKDYIRENQIRLILRPLINELLMSLVSKQNIEQNFQQILSMLKESSTLERSYGAGNIINLMYHLEIDLTDYDFSNLCVWQADLRQAQLHNVNFQNANLAKSVFAENFGGIWSVAFSLDGQYLAAGDTKGSILLRRVADGQPILWFEGHSAWVVSLAFSPDGKTLASGCCDFTAKLWDVYTGQCLHSLTEHEHEVWSVAFSPDGKTLASGCDDQKIRLWNVSTGECIRVLQGHVGEVLSVVFTLDGQKLISGSHDHTIMLWDIKNEQCIRVFQGHEDGVRSISISPDGQILASSSSDRTVRLWDMDTGECLKVFQGHKNVVLSVTFSPQGNLLASSSMGQKVRLWDMDSGECLKVLQGHSNYVNSIAFNPLGNTLASGSNDQSIKLWNVETYQCIKTWQGYSNQALSVTFSHDGQSLASGGHDQRVRLWELKTGKVVRILQEHTNSVFSVTFSPISQFQGQKSNILASGSGDKSIKIWDVDSGRVMKTFWGHESVVRSIVFSFDGKTLASGSEDRTIRLWNVDSGKLQKILRGHKAEIWSIALSPDGQILASASFDSTIKLWDLQTGKCLKTLGEHKSWVWATTFSPDNQTLASISADQTIRLWDIKTGRCRTIWRDDLGNSQLVIFSNDGRILATYNQEHNIRLWHVHNGECFKTLQGHTALINSIAFSPDDHTLLSSSEDETIKLWDLSNGKCLKTLRPKNPYADMNIDGVTGLSRPTIETLKILGANAGF